MWIIWTKKEPISGDFEAQNVDYLDQKGAHFGRFRGSECGLSGPKRSPFREILGGISGIFWAILHLIYSILPRRGR